MDEEDAGREWMGTGGWSGEGGGWKSFDPAYCWPQKKLPMAPRTARRASFLQPINPGHGKGAMSQSYWGHEF